MIWFVLYIAAMFCIAVPVALFGKNEVAGVVFAVWSVGQVAYQIGFPEPWTQVVIYGFAFGWMWCRILAAPKEWSFRCIFAVIMFAPLMIVCMRWGIGTITQDEAWWPIWLLAMAQVGSLVRPIKWSAAAGRWVGRRKDTPPDNLLRYAA